MDISEITGLSGREVTQKQQKFGFNELPNTEKKSLFQLIIGLLTEPMIFLLIFVVIIYAFLGDKTEALVLSLSVIGVMVLELYQESKTEKTLEALRNLSSPIAEVIRDGEKKAVPGRELVVGDIVMLFEGGRVPSDARLLSAENLLVDESLLTGESVPVEKNDEAQESDKTRQLFSGSMVVKGHGLAEITAIGRATEMGRIGVSLNAITPEKTLLQKEITKVVKLIAVIAVSISVLLTVLFWLTRGSLLHGFLAGLTLAIAILPEEFPVVLTVFMALGAWRLAKNHVLTRKSQTIETLGSASVLCVDKTGTLTENRMQVNQITNHKGVITSDSESAYAEVIRYGVLSSQIKPFDPMEEAFISRGKKLFGQLEKVYDQHKIIKEYPLDETSLSVVHIWGKDEQHPSQVALKGAPEAVFKLCKLSKQQSDQLETVVKSFAKDGLRVLGVAKGETKTVPADRGALEYEFLGLVALADPIRKEAAPAVKLCRQAGIRVIMITGDYAETARRIGGEVGLDDARVITGSELEAMNEKQQDKIIKTTSIFSRVSPAHKLTIVNSLKRNGEVVAMTGDGVNDAPALKSAHIGIAMGRRGTDVAREAATIVLLDDNFASIVHGVRIGRRIFANLQKAMAYILVVHMPIIMLSLLPILFGWPVVLLPIHIVFFEFIIDPSCTLIFEGESEEPDTMHRPPRQLHATLFSKHIILRSLLQGLVVSLVLIAALWWMRTHGWSDDKSRALTFFMLVFANIFVILAISGRRTVQEAFKKGLNALVVVVAITFVSLMVVYTVPFTLQLFKFAPITLAEAGIGVVSAAIAALFVTPIQKLIQERVIH